ncbi:MAG: DUF3472 domain-containing protein [Bacteroidales bacterium]
MKRLLPFLAASFLLLIHASCGEDHDNEPFNGHVDFSVDVPTEGNSWFFSNPDGDNTDVWDIGAQSWTHPATVLRTYFRIESAGDLKVGIRASVESGTSELKLTFEGDDKEISLTNQNSQEIYLDTYSIDAPGYYYLDIQGISREALEFAEVTDVLLAGSATEPVVHYVKEEYFYWGRRGPSVHLTYDVPEEASEVRWFYNEVTVPDDNDVEGSFFMANGFSQGYFGFQVNSPQERRVLFSVWSPYVTDDPSEIPDDERVELLAQGENVVVQDFGGEGSGGQSYLPYYWEAGNTYRFLLNGEPVNDNKTDFTAYFYSVELDEWQLIASWRRPETNTYLTGLHSFLENFVTSTGPLTRKAFYNNQWIKDTGGNWYELTTAHFTADATARDKARLDYAGGLESDQEGFFMKNCGFFNETTGLDIYFQRQPLGEQPDVDLSDLPE